jgi:hypothetical protein
VLDKLLTTQLLIAKNMSLIIISWIMAQVTIGVDHLPLSVESYLPTVSLDHGPKFLLNHVMVALISVTQMQHTKTKS